MKSDPIAVHFSGGTDSTLTAALMAEHHQKIHLVTFDRYGFHETHNSKKNASALQERFGKDRYIHTIIRIDDLFKKISYENYLKNFKKHGFYLLSTCGLCKLAMHTKMVEYCLEQNIKYVCDGANQGMSLYPDQMESVIAETRTLYSHFGLHYSNPVYNMAPPEDKPYVSEQLTCILNSSEGSKIKNEETPGKRLYDLGLAPAPNVKGSPYDKKRQPRCFQLIIFHIFALMYVDAKANPEKYKQETLSFFSDKIEFCKNLLKKRIPKESTP